ncbi:MAG: hypothetical protein AVO35_00785 [Candidatus Aegiribacteria sp. MLS_C]|nr:MAG: hypothetical protein AVO35_00785 [Candidatus Aegiribacteria sp. MLS_C]
MDQHTVKERKLKTEIHFKNAIRKDLVESVRQLHEWQERLNTIHNIRKEKKLRRTVARYREYIEDMREFLDPLLDELEDSIKAEMSFSEEEIGQFREEVKEDSKLAAEAREAFDRIRAAAEKAEDKKLTPEELAALKESYSKAWRAFRLEEHRLEEAREELESEKVDREIFKRELKRIQVERHFIKEV